MPQAEDYPAWQCLSVSVIVTLGCSPISEEDVEPGAEPEEGA